MSLGTATATGQRPYNEDRALVRDLSSVRVNLGGLQAFLMVSDGMGGHEAGDVAAEIACEVAERRISELLRLAQTQQVQVDPARLLWDIADEAHAAIARAASDRGGISMGATLVAALASNTHAWVAHVGDSRAYLLSRDAAHQLTADHSRVSRLQAEGVLTQQEARSHPERNVIERALGFEAHDAEVAELDLAPGDALFLCSDGVHDVLADADLLRVAAGAPAAEDAAHAVVAAALDARADDNVTVAIWSPAWELFAGEAAAGVPRRSAPTLVGGQPKRFTASRRRRRQRWLLPLVAIVALAVVAGSVALALGADDNAVSVTKKETQAAQAETLNTVRKQLQAVGKQYAAAARDAREAEADNVQDLSTWSKRQDEYVRDAKTYPSRKAAREQHNAAERARAAANPPHQETYQEWDQFSETYKSHTRQVPGYSPNIWGPIAKPTRPRLVAVDLEAIASQIDRAQGALEKVAVTLGGFKAAPELEDAATELSALLVVLRTKVGGAQKALAKAVTVDGKGNHRIDLSLADTFDNGGIADAIAAVREALVAFADGYRQLFGEEPPLKWPLGKD